MAVWDAARKGDLRGVKAAIKNGADIEARGGDPEGTGLHHACNKGRVEIVRYLLDQQANVGAVGWRLRQPLHWAAKKGHLEIVCLLIERQANVHSRDEYGWTSLHFASHKGHTSVADSLIEHGAQVNTRDKDGNLPIHFACKGGHLLVVKLLISKGSEFKSTNKYGKAPVHLAVEKKHTSVVDYLTRDCVKVNNECQEATGAKTRWKSVKHKAKYQKMLDPNTNTTKIGPVRVSFTLEFLIGRGCQGTCVYYGLHDDGSEVALKRILAHIYEGSEKEIAKLVDLKTSDHIVNYRGIVSDTTFLYVILDLCEETLADYVKAHDREFLERRGPVIIREILTGLQALHTGDKIVLHRDLKPQNILVDLEGRMRLADFGVSRILEQDESTQSTDPHGTLGWVAVESIKVNEDGRVKFNRKSDIQVVGMVCFYVLTKGEHPFGSKDERHSNIKNGSPVNLEKLSDPIAKRFISWLISHQIEDRPYADQALADPYLQLRSGSDPRNYLPAEEHRLQQDK